MENWIVPIIFLAIFGWIFYRKAIKKTSILPNSGGGKGGWKLP